MIFSLLQLQPIFAMSSSEEIQPLECYTGITTNQTYIAKWNHKKICPSHSVNCVKIVIGIISSILGKLFIAMPDFMRQNCEIMIL